LSFVSAYVVEEVLGGGSEASGGLDRKRLHVDALVGKGVSAALAGLGKRGCRARVSDGREQRVVHGYQRCGFRNHHIEVERTAIVLIVNVRTTH
jgi:hypothetical protein